MHNSKTKWFISFIVIALLLTVVTGVGAQSNIVVTLSAGGAAATVGDVLPLTLRVTHPAGWRVIVPTLDKQWGDFEVRNQSTLVISASGNGAETTSQRIEVVRMRPGEVQTPPFKLSIADDQGNLQDVEVAPVAVTIQSVLVAGDTTLRDLKPQAELLISQRMVWPLIVLLMLSVVAWGIYFINRRRTRPVVDNRTPRQRTLDTLQTLARQNPQTPVDLKAACVEIAACLRDYIAVTTSLAAHDLTTNELARQLKETHVPADWSTHAIEVLRVCDSVKFACDFLELTTIHGLIDTVELLVQQYPIEPAPAARSAKRPKLKKVTA
jgi:hypothetical protein